MFLAHREHVPNTLCQHAPHEDNPFWQKIIADRLAISSHAGHRSVASSYKLPSYVRYLDFNTQAGLLREDISAWELSALLQPRALPGFLRLGYTHGTLRTHSNLVDVGYDEEGGTLLYGLGVDLALPNQSGGKSNGKLRLGYAIADYGRGEIRRLTLGSFVAF